MKLKLKAKRDKATTKMTDSSSFSSLLDLVDSHLSKNSLQSQSEDTSHSLNNHIQIPRLAEQNGVKFDTKLSFSPGQCIGIATFHFGRSPIDSVLAEQISNMLKAKELKRQQEKEQQQLIEETRRLKLEEDNIVIDIMQALQTKYKPEPKKEAVSNSSSLDSPFESNFTDSFPLKEADPLKTPELILPCATDVSYILRQEVKRGKCSEFGKVLTSRLRPVAAPYLREMVESSIVRFNFDTTSPCDLVKEKLRKPTSYNTYNYNIPI